ncbi:siderophore-interacting protein [Flindersiella endophytica]
MPGIRHHLRELARRNQAFTVPVRVDAVERVSAGFVRVTVSGEELSRYEERHPADAFKVFFPPEGARRIDYPQRGPNGLPYWPDGTTQPVLRAFTVRDYSPVKQALTFDIADHADGHAMSWLRSDPTGTAIALSGMRRDFAADPEATDYVFVGDRSALPAIAACVRALPPGARINVHLPELDASDRALLPQHDRLVAHWVRDDLAAAVTRQPAPPAERAQVWIAGEASIVRAIRRHVLEQWHVSRDDLHATAYWKAHHDNTQFDAGNLIRYQEAAAKGLDIVDPDVREDIELSA